MQANFTIRPAQPQDRPILVTFMEQLQDAEREFHRSRPPGSEIGDAHLAYLEELVRTQKGQIYVAEALQTEPQSAASPQDILGFVVCFVETIDEGDLHVVESEREYGYISDLYVVSPMRKQGVAATLMRAAEQHFCNLGLAVVRVGLLHSNDPAARFYQKTGYQPYEIVYEKHLRQ